MSESAPLTVAMIGAGHRTRLYASYAHQQPQRMKVVAIAEPDPVRRAAAAREHGIPADRQFAGYAELAAQPQLADAAINGTMDRLHRDSSLALLERGYHLLLEKPIATSEAHVRELVAAAREHRRTVMVCHVLRYAPFYQTVKRLLDEGAIGRVVAMHTSENVSYHHMAVAFVRGRWNRTERSAPMILAKCCHDLDIIAWLMSGQRVEKVASFGSLMQFRPENAPVGATQRCLGGCSIEATCQYSSRRNYIEQKLWGDYAWESIQHIEQPTLEDKLESLRNDNPYGRCVWHCDNDVVDHQSVIVHFEGGATVTHNMLCATARPTRTIHIVGSHGELEGDLEGGWMKIRRPSTQPGGFVEENVDLGNDRSLFTGHGGGDLRLVDDFVRVVRGEPASRGSTHIADSLTGHLIAFAAETARRESRVVLVRS